jgi:hypothetical protein
MIKEAEIRRQHMEADASLTKTRNELFSLGHPGEFALCRHNNLLRRFAAVRSGVQFTKAAVSRSKDCLRRFSMLFYSYKDSSKVSGFGPVAKKSLHRGGRLTFYLI